MCVVYIYIYIYGIQTLERKVLRANYVSNQTPKMYMLTKRWVLSDQIDEIIDSYGRRNAKLEGTEQGIQLRVGARGARPQNSRPQKLSTSRSFGGVKMMSSLE